MNKIIQIKSKGRMAKTCEVCEKTMLAGHRFVIDDHDVCQHCVIESFRASRPYAGITGNQGPIRSFFTRRALLKVRKKALNAIPDTASATASCTAAKQDSNWPDQGTGIESKKGGDARAA